MRNQSSNGTPRLRDSALLKVARPILGYLFALAIASSFLSTGFAMNTEHPVEGFYLREIWASSLRNLPVTFSIMLLAAFLPFCICLSVFKKGWIGLWLFPLGGLLSALLIGPPILLFTSFPAPAEPATFWHQILQTISRSGLVFCVSGFAGGCAYVLAAESRSLRRRSQF